jgi:thymidine kinase
MYSGKTEELVRLLRRAGYARRHVLLIRPATDTRSAEVAMSRSGTSYPSAVVSHSDEIPALAAGAGAEIVAIDEAQFFDSGIVEVVEQLAATGCQVIVVGLDLDFLARPFGAMASLMAKADEVRKLSAICMVCGADATRTQRLINGQPARINDPLVLIGGLGEEPGQGAPPPEERYEARCRQHHFVPIA